MRFEGFFVSVVAIHSGNDIQVTLFECRSHLAEKVTRTQEFAAMMVRNLCRIKCYDAASVDEHGINLERCPIVGPPVHVHRDRVTLIEVDLAAPAHRRIPSLW